MTVFLVERLKRLNATRLSRLRARRRAVDRRAPLALIATVKNEALSLGEWIEHYRWQGVDHIFLIDNGSTDATREVIEPWVRDGYVTCHDLPRPQRQLQHVRQVFRRERVRQRFRWLLVADADEFWFCKDGRTLPDGLAEIKWDRIIYCYWKMFGCGGREDHPASLRKELVRCQPGINAQRSTKWIAQTDVLWPSWRIDIHRINGGDSRRTISGDDLFQVNHYMTQSRRFWGAVKMARGDAFFRGHGRYWDEFDRIEALCTGEDRLLADLVRAREAEFPAVAGRRG